MTDINEPSHLILPGQTAPGDPDNLLSHRHRTQEDWEALMGDQSVYVDPAQDLWSLVGRYNQDGGLPDPTAPGYIESNRSGEILTTGLLVLINVVMFIPMGLRLGALKDVRSGILGGWELRPYVGNEYTDEEIKHARAGVERRWPGMEDKLGWAHKLGQKINVLHVEIANPEIGATREEINRAHGVKVQESTEPVHKTEVDRKTGLPTESFQERPVDGKVTYCVACKVVPIVGDMSQFEPIEVSEGGGFRCSGCQAMHVADEFAEFEKEHKRRLGLANPDGIPGA